MAIWSRNIASGFSIQFELLVHDVQVVIGYYSTHNVRPQCFPVEDHTVRRSQMVTGCIVGCLKDDTIRTIGFLLIPWASFINMDSLTSINLNPSMDK